MAEEARGKTIRVTQKDKVLILGDYQTGKSTLARRLADQQRRRMVWDFAHFYPYGTSDLDTARRHLEEHGRTVYQPSRGDLESKFHDFCELALEQHNLTVFIDEARRELLGDDALDDLSRLGHKAGVGTIIAAHSIWDVPHVVQQYHHFFCFRVSRVVDINVLKQLLPEKATLAIPKLPNYYFWYQSTRDGWLNAPIPIKPPGRAPVQKATEGQEEIKDRQQSE